MLSGSEEIWYTPVEAYGVSTFEEGIISGGGGGDATISGGVRFYWVYYPETPGEAPSGFTGLGWFESEANTPMNYYLTSKGKGLQDILSEFDNNTRNNLNDVFEVWSTYVSSQKPGNCLLYTSRCV